MGNPKIHLSCSLGFLLLFLVSSSPSSPSTTNPNATLDSSFLCHIRQSHALLQFKSNFVINASASRYCYESSTLPYPKTESWKESTDCCSSWDGVTCDGESGHVIGLDLSCSQLQGTIHSNSTLFSSHLAPYLQELNLAFNDFQGSKMSPEFGVKFGSSLTHLNLSWTGFSGNIPSEISHLSNIVSLDLSCYYYRGLRVESDRVVERIAQNLTQLRVLSLDGVNMSSVHASSLMNLSSSLTCLSLRGCEFQGQFLEKSSGFLEFVGNQLKSLRELRLDRCNISGSIPPSLGNLVQLTHLELFMNRLNGPIPASFSNLTHLAYLDMSDNELEGPFPSYLFALPSLINVDLHNNKLYGQIPTSPVKCLNLTNLDLSENNLSGIQDFDVFLNLKKLEYLDLSNNNISSSSASASIDINLSYSLPNFRYLDLSGCNLNQFPTFIKALTNLTVLAVSDNQIQGPIPQWMYDVGKYTLSIIDLSGNLLTSVGHQLHWKNIEFVNFHSNLLQGPLPILPTTIDYFSVSNNTLSGEISSLICNLTQLASLDLSHNKFIGVIPQCLGSLSSLTYLNLGLNSFHGVIPNTFTKNNILDSLVLNGNQLTGTIPQTLSYCLNLQILDLANNMIEDTVSHWLETLSSLEVLVLRSNKFYGSLNGLEEKLLFPALKLLDLSNNNFTGGIPIKLIRSLNAMTKVDEHLENGRLYMRPSTMNENLYYSVVITVKGLELEHEKIFTRFAIIDISRNKLEGYIPEVIGKLILLKGLNLSHNLLSGHIPSSIGDLGSLEWLDLSHNTLNGEIPREMTNLNFLQVLDLSSNQLHGAVPQGKQFNTFGNDSYKDNLALCGFPLTKACGPNHEQPSDTSEDKTSSDSKGGFNWEGVFAGYGCGIVFGLSMGYLVFKTRSPKWFVKIFQGKQRGRVGKRSKRRAGTRN